MIICDSSCVISFYLVTTCYSRVQSSHRSLLGRQAKCPQCVANDGLEADGGTHGMLAVGLPAVF